MRFWRCPIPPADLSYSYGLAQYARGVAYAATGRPAEAQASLDSLVKTRATIKPDYATAGWSTPGTVLEIAEHSLRGEMALRSGDASAARSTHFKAAAAIEDGSALHRAARLVLSGTPFAGPGAAQGKSCRRSRGGVSRRSARFPGNGWALFGLAQSLEGSGQGHHRSSTQFQTRLALGRHPVDGFEVFRDSTEYRVPST